MYAIAENSTGKIIVTVDPLELSLYSRLSRNAPFLEGTQAEMESVLVTLEVGRFGIITSPRPH